MTHVPCRGTRLTEEDPRKNTRTGGGLVGEGR